MVEKRKPYQKAGVAFKVLGWILLVCVVIMLFSSVISGSFTPKFLLIIPIPFLFFLLGNAIHNHKKWGRIIGIILGIFYLPGFPILTILGGFILWWLIKGWDEDTEPELADDNIVRGELLEND